MIIKADKEGQKVIAELLDLALKTGGLQVLSKIQTVLQSIQDLEEIPVGAKPMTTSELAKEAHNLKKV